MAPHTLTAQEQTWARALRDALKAADVTLPAASESDMLLCQFAIIGKGKTEKAVERVKNYIKFVCGEYEFETNAAASNPAVIGGMHRLWPSMMTFTPNKDGHPALWSDIKPYEPSLITEELYLPLFQEFLLIMDAMTCDLDEVRAGCIFGGQVGGMGLRHVNMELEKRGANLYQESYPIRFYSWPVVGANRLFRVVIKLMKALFLKQKLADRIALIKVEKLGRPPHNYPPECLPACLGGTCTRPYTDELRERLARRAESIAKVRIDAEPEPAELM